MFGIDAEIVDGSLGIGFGIGGQPSLCDGKSAMGMWDGEEAATYQYQLY